MEKISIIVPVYNTEPYLRKCLESILNQTHTNLEILCIDDGSTDNSVGICEEYANRDSRIKVIHKKTKGGSGTPCFSQNIGLKIFTGEYVGFCDADDWVESDMYEVLYKTIKENNVSVGIANYYFETGEHSIVNENKLKIPKGILSQRNLLTYLLDLNNYQGFVGTNWCKVYSSKIIRSNANAVFNTELRACHDLLFDTNIFLTEGCTGAYTARPLYHWVQHERSISHKYKLKSFTDNLKAIKIIVEILNSSPYADTSHYLIGHFGASALAVFYEGVINNNEELKKLGLIELEYFNENKDYLRFSKVFPDLLLTKIKYEELKDNNILLFGSGYYGKKAKLQLESNKINVYRYVDNDKSKQGTTLLGVPIISPKKSLEIQSKKYVIATLPYSHMIIYNQLKSMGIENKDIYIM